MKNLLSELKIRGLKMPEKIEGYGYATRCHSNYPDNAQDDRESLKGEHWRNSLGSRRLDELQLEVWTHGTFW